MKKRLDKIYGIGLLLLVFGGAGLAEHITSNRGNFIVSTVVFSLGFAMVIRSYFK